MINKILIFVLVAVAGLLVLATTVQADRAPLYISPQPGATMILPGTTIAFRPGELLNAQSVSGKLFEVIGSISGLHLGQSMLSDDQRTIIFKPDDPFAFGETVSVLVASGLISVAGQAVEGRSFSFQIASQKSPKVPLALNEVDLQAAQGHSPASAGSASQTNSRFLTLPYGFPSYTITVPANITTRVRMTTRD